MARDSRPRSNDPGLSELSVTIGANRRPLAQAHDWLTTQSGKTSQIKEMGEETPLYACFNRRIGRFTRYGFLLWRLE